MATKRMPAVVAPKKKTAAKKKPKKPGFIEQAELLRQRAQAEGIELDDGTVFGDVRQH